MKIPGRPSLPVASRPGTFELLENLATDVELPEGLLQGAFAISTHGMPGSCFEDVDVCLQEYANKITNNGRRVQIPALVAHLHEVMFEVSRFHGYQDNLAAEHYYLPAILRSKKGTPTTLSLIYKMLADRVGLRCYGISLCGTFMVGIQCNGEIMFIDPFFQGMERKRDEIEDAILKTSNGEIALCEKHLEPVENQLWLVRILDGLQMIFKNAGQYVDVAAVIEMKIALCPDWVYLWKELAFALVRLDKSALAITWLMSYLEVYPANPERGDVLEFIKILERTV